MSPPFTSTQLDTTSPDYRVWLQAELIRRCKTNPSYSANAFARALKVSASYLSRVMTGKRPLTVEAAEAMVDRLHWTPEETSTFIGLVKTEQKSKRQERLSKKRGKRSPLPDYLTLSADAFVVISDWHHYAIAELTYVTGFKNNMKWIARKLGISVDDATQAVARLKRMGILVEDTEGNLRDSKGFVTTTQDIESKALQNWHHQVIELALRSISATPVPERDLSCITMAVDESRIPEAKKKIARFRRQMCQFMEEGPRTRVYNLAIQLYPLSSK